MMNWPESVAGNNSVPSSGKTAMLAINRIATVLITAPLCSSARAANVHSAQPGARIRVRTRPKKPDPVCSSAARASFSVRKVAQYSGITVIETTYDAAIDNTTASDSALKRYFATPNRNITGENTMIVVTVEASTASATSWRRRAPRGGRLSLREMTIDIFQHHRGVIDQASDRQCEAAESHDVDGRAGGHQSDQPGKNRQRDRQKDRERRAEAAQKDQDQYRGEHRAGYTLTLEAIDSGANIGVLPENRLQLHPLGQVGDFREKFFDPVNDRRGCSHRSVSGPEYKLNAAH